MESKASLGKRIISAVMSVVLAVGLCPVPAFADSGSGGSLGAATLSADTLAGDQAADVADEGDDDDESVSVDAASNGTQVYWFYAWRQKTLLIASNSNAVTKRAEELGYGWGASWIENIYTGDAKNSNTNPAKISNSYNSEAQRDSDLPYISCETVEVLGTIAPSNMWYWFEDWRALKTLDLSNVNMANTVDYTLMCKDCPALTTVKLPASFATNAANKNVRGMFYGCTNLKTVYCPSTITSVACKLVDEGWWNDDAPRLPEKFDPFYGTNLVGSMGTAYASSGKGDKSLFRTDWGDQGAGYISGPTATITYSDNGRNHSPDTRAIGMSYTLDQPDGKAGYKFAGWKAANGTTYTAGQKITVSANLALTAQYDPITYAITYNANGGTGAPAAQTKTHGTALTLSSTKPTKTSTAGVTTTLAFADGVTANKALTSTATTTYPFTTWNTAANGSGTSYSAGGSYTANAAATLYAQWGTPTVSGSAVTLPTPTRTGYTFKGWKDASGAVRSAGSYSPTTSGTLTAQWEANSVKYKVNHYQMTTSGTWPSTPTATEELSGKVGAQTAAAAKTYAGFTSTGTNNADTATTITQVTIPASGTATVNIYYTRNKYTLTVTNDANSSIASGSATTGSYYYGSKVTLKGAAKTGYAWSGWTSSNAGLLANNANQNATIEMPAGNVTMTATSTPAKNTAYKVEHYQMNVDGKNYVLKETENKTGTTGADTAAAAKTYEGFTSTGTTQGGSSSAIKQQKIAADGSTVVKVYYKRNAYQFTLAADANSTTEGSSASGSYLFGATVTLKGAAKDGFTWKQWESSDASLVPNKTAATTSFTMPAGNVTMTATSVAKDVNYKVEHYQMNVDGKTFSLKETETKTGPTGSKTAAAAKPYAGFTCTGTTQGGSNSTIEQATIAGNGSTVVKVYYDRNRYKFTLKAGTGATTKGSTLSGSYLFGATIKLVGAAKEGYEWSHWASSNTDLVNDLGVAATEFTMPTGDITMTATAEPAKTVYKVEHYKMTLSGEDYELASTEEKKGDTDAATAAEAGSYAGFTCTGSKKFGTAGDAIAQQKIAADGSTVVKVYYTRNQYSLAIEADEGATTTGSASAAGKYYYGAKINLKGGAKAGYVWSQWSATGLGATSVGNRAEQSVSFEMPAGDLTMTATTEPGTTAYKVVHHKMGLDGTFLNNDVVVEEKTGTTGAKTVAEVKGFPGFTCTGTAQSGSRPVFEESTIAGDGTTVVNLYYTRNKFHLTLAADDNSTIAGSPMNTGDFLFGQKVTIKGGAKTGCKWVGWTSSDAALVANKSEAQFTFEMPAGDVTLTATSLSTEQGEAAYVVEHYWQNVKDDKFTLHETERKTGKIGEMTAAVAKKFEGFTAKPFEQAKIDVNGKTIVKVYYTRNVYKFTLGTADHANTAGSTASGSFKFGADITLKCAAVNENGAASKFICAGWASSDEGLVRGLAWDSTTFTMPAGDLTMTPVIRELASGNSFYRVQHYKMTADGKDWALADEEVVSGVAPGDEVKPAVKDYEGFVAPAVQTATVDKFGSVVVKYYYDRKNYKFTLGSAAGIDTAGSTQSGEVRFGATVKLKASAAAGVKWGGWRSSDDDLVASTSEAETTFEMPASDVTMTPVVKAEWGVDYKVKHLKEALDGSWELAEEVVVSDVKAGSEVTPAVLEFEGFTAPEPQTVQVAADDSTVVEYLYKRNSYAFTLGSCEGVQTAGSFETGNYLFGQQIRLTAKVEKGYAWEGWQSSNEALVANQSGAETTFEMPAGDVTFTPKASQASHSVTYHKNDGTSAVKNAGVVSGKPWTVADADLFSREGQTLVGWNTKADGTGVTFTCGSEQAIWAADADVDLFAVWAAKGKEPRVAKVEVSAEPVVYSGAELAQLPLTAKVFGRDGKELAKDSYEVKFVTDGGIAAVASTGAALGKGGMPLNAGIYTARAIVTEKAGGAVTGNWITVETAFSIERAPLSIVAGAAQKVAGENDPELTWFAEGLQGSDAVKPEPSLVRDPGEEPGLYAVRAMGAGVVSVEGDDRTANYDVAYVDGGLTVLEADPERRVEVKVAEGLTYRAAEFAWDEILSVKRSDKAYVSDSFEVKACTPLEMTGARFSEKGLPLTAGYYLANVEVKVVDNAGASTTFDMMVGFWIAKAPLTITAGDAAKKANAAEPALTWKVEGLKGDDKVSPEPKLARKAGEAAGEYAITATDAGVVGADGSDVTACYEIAYVNGKMTVTSSETPAAKVERLINEDVAKAIQTMTDEDAKDSTFSLLQLHYTKATKNSIKLKWKKAAGAKTYVVFGAQCGKGKKYGVLTKTTGAAYTYKSLKKGVSYKAVVKAYDANGKCIATSKTVHVFTKGSKYGNVKKLKLSKKKLSLKVKKGAKLKSKLIKAGKKLKQHRKVQYESTNPQVATVDVKKGKVKAIKKGSCYIYAYACDGTMAKCKVTVK